MAVIKLRRRAYEKPEPVFNNWSTNRGARIRVVEVVAWRIDVTQSSGAGSLNKRIRLELWVTIVDFSSERLSRTESIRLKLHSEVAVKFITLFLHDALPI